jgi:hypothetical protein
VSEASKLLLRIVVLAALVVSAAILSNALIKIFGGP